VRRAARSGPARPAQRPPARYPATVPRPSLILAVALMSACGTTSPRPAPDAGTPPTGDAGPPTVELGVGDSEFLPLAEGADAELVFGPQGGYHIVFGACLRGLTPVDGMVLSYDVRRADGALLGETPLGITVARLLRKPDGGFARVGDFVVLSITGPPDVLGATLTVHVSLRDAGGTLVDEDTRHVVVVDRL